MENSGSAPKPLPMPLLKLDDELSAYNEAGNGRPVELVLENVMCVDAVRLKWNQRVGGPTRVNTGCAAAEHTPKVSWNGSEISRVAFVSSGADCCGGRLGVGVQLNGCCDTASSYSVVLESLSVMVMT